TLIKHHELLVLLPGDGGGHDRLRVHHAIVLQEDLEEVLGEAAHHGHPGLRRRHRRRRGVAKVPEHDLRHRVAVAGAPELPADGLVVGLPVVGRRLVELHVAEHEHGPDHLLRRQPAVDGRAEDLVEHRLEVGVHAPVHPLHEPQLLGEGLALDHVELGPRAEGDHPPRPRLLAELRREHAERHAHVHRRAGHAPGHVAHGDAVAQGALGAEVVHHAAPLQLGHVVLLAAHGGGRDLVRQERARRDLGLALLDGGEVLGEAVLVVLLEQGLVAPHGHGGDAGVGQLGPSPGAHVHLGELENVAQRHQRFPAEAAEDAVGVVLVRELGVVWAGVAREEAAGDGLAEQRRPVKRRSRRGAPLGGESDLPPLAAGGQLLEVGGEEFGEELGDAVEQEAVGAVAVVPLQRLHGELARLPRLLRDLLILRLPAHPLLLLRLPRLGRRHGVEDAAATVASAALSAGQCGSLLLPGLAHLVGGRLGLAELADVVAVDQAEQQLGEVLEVAELGEGGDVAGERPRVVLVHPQRGGVEPLLVGLAGAAHAAEVADELERGERVVRPRGGDEAADAVGGRVGDDLEEEVEAGVARVGVGGGVVLGAGLPR
ncbi:Os09g0499450, partial [Oryza sativa Japonica Group]